MWYQFHVLSEGALFGENMVLTEWTSLSNLFKKMSWDLVTHLQEASLQPRATKDTVHSGGDKYSKRWRIYLVRVD